MLFKWGWNDVLPLNYHLRVAVDGPVFRFSYKYLTNMPVRHANTETKNFNDKVLAHAKKQAGYVALPPRYEMTVRTEDAMPSTSSGRK